MKYERYDMIVVYGLLIFMIIFLSPSKSHLCFKQRSHQCQVGQASSLLKLSKNCDFPIISGSVWIYKAWGTIHSDGYVHCTDKILVNCTKGTCNDTLLTFAFAMVTMDWIFTALWVSVLGCTLARACKTRVMFFFLLFLKTDGRTNGRTQRSFLWGVCL